MAFAIGHLCFDWVIGHLHLGIWVLGYLGTWAFGYLGFGHLRICIFGIYTLEHLGICHCGLDCSLQLKSTETVYKKCYVHSILITYDNPLV